MKQLPTLTSFHEDVDVIGRFGEVDKPDDVGMIDFLTDLDFRLDSFDDVNSQLLLLLHVLCVLNLALELMILFC